MITAGLFSLIGIAIFIGAKISNIAVSSTDIWTEYLGDGSQSILEHLVRQIEKGVRDRIEKNKLGRIINSLFASAESKETFKKVFLEIKKYEEKQSDELKKLIGKTSLFQKVKEAFAKFSERFKKDKTIDGGAIIKLSNSILWELDYREYLITGSSTFAELGGKEKYSEEKNTFIELLNYVVEVYQKDVYARLSEDKQVMSDVIVNSLKIFIDDREEKLLERIKTLLFQIGNHDNGVNLQKVEIARYAPKYILNACPECGYDGDRIYTDERTNTTHCAACGKSFSVLKYCEPELWQEINEKIGAISNGVGKLDEKLIGYFNNNEERLSEFKDLLKNLETIDVESRNQIIEGLANVATKEYLDKCLKNQGKDFKELVSNAFVEFGKQIADFKARQEESICEIIQNINRENTKFNNFLSRRLNALDNQIGSLYNYAKEQFGGLEIKSDLVLEYVKKLCTKEYFESRTNALGTDLKKAITDETQKGYSNIVALNADSVAQIMAAIDDIKERCINEDYNGTDSERIKKIISEENQQLSGKINTLQNLVENGNQESRSAFRKIIDSQEEIKAILLSKIGLKVGHQEVERMYSGKIPDKYIINDGFDGEFTCLYCGATAEHKVNSEQVCKCVVCGKHYYKIKPEYIDEVCEKYGKDKGDELLATDENIKRWQKSHEAEIVSGCIKWCSSFDKDKILLIPDSYMKDNTISNLVFFQSYGSDDWKRSIEMLIFSGNLQRLLTDDIFEGLNSLKKIVFLNEYTDINKIKIKKQKIYFRKKYRR